MISTWCHRLIPCVTSITSKVECLFVQERQISLRYTSTAKSGSSHQQQLNDSDTELVVKTPRQILEESFPDSYTYGKFVPRHSYVDFIDSVLDRIQELGLEKDLETYKELLRVFPPGKFMPTHDSDRGLFHAPQQLAAIRIIDKMCLFQVCPDGEVMTIIDQRFSNRSDVWNKLARVNYWTMKMRNCDPNPLPEVLPQKTHEIAKVALMRMLDDTSTIINVRNTSSLPDSLDKTWVVYAQSKTQQNIINRLKPKDTLYVEEFGLTYVGNKFLSYYCIRTYDSDEDRKLAEELTHVDYNYNKLKMQFYGKPVKEALASIDKRHHDGMGYILSLGITGSSSHDSVLSWIKMVQSRNPNMSNLNVIFKLDGPKN